MRGTVLSAKLFAIALNAIAGFCCAAAVAQVLPAQDSPAPQPVTGSPNLLRLEATDGATGIHYVRLMLSPPPAPADVKAPPRFTLECTDDAGRRDLSLLVTFGGVTSTAFTPPFRPTPELRKAPPEPTVSLAMDFEGYMKWPRMTRAWAQLPTGELRYKDPGMKSSNMESPKVILAWLNSLPGLRIWYAHPAIGTPPAVLFETRPLLNEMAKTPLCH